MVAVMILTTEPSSDEAGFLAGVGIISAKSIRSTRPEWLRDKTAKAIVQYGAEKLAELPGVPFAPDLVTNSEDRLVMQAAFAPLVLGRPFLMPPGVAAERVAALRSAFAATMAIRISWRTANEWDLG